MLFFHWNSFTIFRLCSKPKAFTFEIDECLFFDWKLTFSILIFMSKPHQKLIRHTQFNSKTKTTKSTDRERKKTRKCQKKKLNAFEIHWTLWCKFTSVFDLKKIINESICICSWFHFGLSQSICWNVSL